MLQKQHTKRVKYYYIDFQMNTYNSLPPLIPFFEGENEILTKMGSGSNSLKKYVWETKREKKEEIQRSQVIGRCDVTISYGGNQHCFQEVQFRKTFLNKVAPITSYHWPYHKDSLVSCLKFRVSLVFEYLSYYYNVTNDYWAIP